MNSSGNDHEMMPFSQNRKKTKPKHYYDFLQRQDHKSDALLQFFQNVVPRYSNYIKGNPDKKSKLRKIQFQELANFYSL